MNPKGIPDNFIEVSKDHWVHPSWLPPSSLVNGPVAQMVEQGATQSERNPEVGGKAAGSTPVRPTKPLLNVTEQRCFDLLESEGVTGIMKQAITLRLDPPFKRYTPDLAYNSNRILVLIEVKGLHRFRRAGIAKAALAAKTYPQFLFKLYEWDGGWKITLL